MINCPCCKSEILEKSPYLNGYFSYKCKSCLHEFFLNNNSNISSDLYKNDSDYIGDLEKSKNYKYLIQWNHLKAGNYLKKLKNVKTILDIGTFNGFFVKFLREKGFNAFGTDFNDNAIKNGLKNYQLDGYLSSNLDDFKLKNYNCVTAFEVIEHLEDPNQFLQKINKLLCDDGILIISCPNSEMLWRNHVDYPPHHLSRFSPKSLNKILINNGFEVLSHFKQMSLIDLIRNFIGSFLRDSNKSESLKGGSHKKLFFIDPIRNFLNLFRELTYFIAKPFDSILYFLGFRYICQLIIVKKIK